MLKVDELHKKSIQELEALYSSARMQWEKARKTYLKPGARFREQERQELENMENYVALIASVIREKKGE